MADDSSVAAAAGIGSGDALGSITIKVLLFASAREAADNTNQLDLELTSDNDGGGTATDTNTLRNVLADRFPRLASLVLDKDSITLAVNEEYVAAGENRLLRQGDTVALIPPISGG